MMHKDNSWPHSKTCYCRNRNCFIKKSNKPTMEYWSWPSSYQVVIRQGSSSSSCQNVRVHWEEKTKDPLVQWAVFYSTKWIQNANECFTLWWYRCDCVLICYEGSIWWTAQVAKEGEYEVKLLNQISNSMHHSVTDSVNWPNSCKPTSKRNEYAAWYSELFISHDALTATKGFLKDGNIYFQVCKP